MQRLTIGLIVIIILLLGIIGFIFASMGSQSIPTIALSNNTTDNPGQPDSSKLTQTTKKSSTTSKNKTNNTRSNSTGNSTKLRTNSSDNNTNPKIEDNFYP